MILVFREEGGPLARFHGSKRRGWRIPWIGLLVACMALLPVRASAHVVNLLAKVSLVGTELQVSFLDAYNAPLEELTVLASVEEIGGKPGRTVELKESEPGLYAGTLGAPPTDRYQVTISFAMAGDKHQALLTAERGKDQPEVVLPVLGIDLEETSRSLWLFGGAILVLAGATAYALLRTPKDDDDEEAES